MSVYLINGKNHDWRVLVCNGCRAMGPMGEKFHTAIESARQNGWSRRARRHKIEDYCKGCTHEYEQKRAAKARARAGR